MSSIVSNARQLPAVRRTFQSLGLDERGEGNPVKDIALGAILVGIALVISLTILPVVSSAVATAAADTNLSSATVTILNLIPLLFVVGIMAGALAFLFRGFSQLRG